MKKALTKTLSMVLTLIMLITCVFGASTQAYASEMYTANIGGVTYKYTIETDGAHITGVDVEYAAAAAGVTSITLPEELGGQKVVVVGAMALAGKHHFSTVNIPDSVKEIKANAFYASDVKVVVIGKGVEKIEDDAFDECEDVEEYQVAEENTEYCSEAGVLYTEEKDEICKYPAAKEDKEYVAPETVKEVNEDAFEGSTHLTSVSMASVTKVEENAFEDCTSLKTVSFGAYLKTIEKDAFPNCKSITAFSVSKSNKYFSTKDGTLYNKNKTTIVKYASGRSAKSFTVPKSVKTIGYGAFASSKKLTKVSMGNSVTNIKSDAFYSCTALSSVNLSNKTAKIGSQAFSKTKVKKVVMPKTVKEVGYGAYEDCSKLESVDMSKTSVKVVSARAFYGSKKLKNVKMSNKTTSIKAYSFASTSIKNVTIPKSVKTIESYAFEGTSIKSIDIKSKSTKVAKDALPKNAKVKISGKAVSNYVSKIKY